jgi:hypothetical protein
LNGSAKELAAYIPDFGFERYDLTRYSDDEIKGTLMTRVVQLLFKYAFDPDLRTKLPDILSLMKALMGKETGLQYFEIISWSGPTTPIMIQTRFFKCQIDG